MKRALVWILSIAAVAAIGTSVWYFFFRTEQTIDLENYQPSEQFEPAYEALQPKGPDYDIEETVRAMNSLEVAQYKSEDFMSYLEYVAKQDFSRVAPEVLEQKKKLFPILQHLFELQKKYEDFDDVWMIMRSAGTGAATLSENVSPIGLLASFCTGDATLSSMSIVGSLDEAQVAAFEQYEKEKELKSNLEKEIEQVRMAYIEYLEGYAPVYYKYMKEWDALFNDIVENDEGYLKGNV